MGRDGQAWWGHSPKRDQGCVLRGHILLWPRGSAAGGKALIWEQLPWPGAGKGTSAPLPALPLGWLRGDAPSPGVFSAGVVSTLEVGLGLSEFGCLGNLYSGLSQKKVLQGIWAVEDLRDKPKLGRGTEVVLALCPPSTMGPTLRVMTRFPRLQHVRVGFNCCERYLTAGLHSKKLPAKQ